MIKMGIIGFGYWGPNLLRNFHEADGVEMVAASDLSEGHLGRIATRHLLSPTTVSMFLGSVTGRPILTHFDMLLLLSSCEDCEPVLPVDFEELDALADQLRVKHSYLLAEIKESPFRPLEASGKRLLSAIKMALVADAWTQQSDTAAVADAFDGQGASIPVTAVSHEASGARPELCSIYQQTPAAAAVVAYQYHRHKPVTSGYYDRDRRGRHARCLGGLGSFRTPILGRNFPCRLELSCDR